MTAPIFDEAIFDEVVFDGLSRAVLHAFLEVTGGANGTTGVPPDAVYLGSDNAAYAHNGLIDDLKVEIGHATAPTKIPSRRR